MLDRSIAPQFVLPAQVDLIKAESQKLSNGCPLHIINAGSTEVVRLEIIFQAGSKFENQTGLSYFTSKMLSEGTKKKSAKEIAEYLELFGAFFELHHGPDSFNLTFYSLRKFLKEVCDVVCEILTESTFPEEELTNIKNITSQHIKVNLNKTSYLASNKFKESLFGKKNPYGRLLDEENINSVEKPLVIDFFQDHISGCSFDVVLSGNVDENSIKVLESSIGQIPVFVKSKPSQNSSVSGYSPSVITVKKEDSLQSSLRIGSLSITKSNPDYFYWVMLNEIFGGYFGSRLMKNIREDKGFTYGISSNIVHLRDVSYFVIGTDVKKENTIETLAEIEREIEILKTTLIPDSELETVKSYMIGTFLSSINTPFSLADKFKSIYFFNLDYSFYENYLTCIRNCTSEKLLELAGLYLDYDKMLKVVAGEMK